MQCVRFILSFVYKQSTLCGVMSVLVDVAAWCVYLTFPHLCHLGSTPLHLASISIRGNLNLVKLLVKAGSYIDDQGGYCSRTALHSSVIKGRALIAKYLIEVR
jgi:hypothetical protein